MLIQRKSNVLLHFWYLKLTCVTFSQQRGQILICATSLSAAAMFVYQ